MIKGSKMDFKNIIILLLLIIIIFLGVLISINIKNTGFDNTKNSKVWVDVVSDYGADPSGTFDSSNNIQKAIDYASKHGKVVAFAPGTYLISKTLRIEHPKQKAIKLVGLAANNSYYGINTNDTLTVTLKRPINTTHDFIYANGRSLTIQGLVFDGVGTKGNGISIDRGFEFKIIDCHFYNIRGNAVKGLALQNATLEGNHFNKSGSPSIPALYIGGGKYGISNTVSLNNNHYERNFGTDLAFATSGDSKDYAEFIFISGNHFESTDDTGGVIKKSPIIEIGNSRGIEVVNSLIYGGNGPLVKINHDNSRGIAFTNTFFLGDRTKGKGWKAGKLYKKGDFIIPPKKNGYVYVAINEGISGVDEPKFTTKLNQIISDGSINWKIYSNTINVTSNIGNKDAPKNLIELSKGNGVSFVNCQYSTAKEGYILIEPKFGEVHVSGGVYLHENEKKKVVPIIDLR
jgi:Pectate lyase superfamily protein